MQRIVHSLEETVAQIHVADGVNVVEVHRAGHLTVVMSPVVLDAFHMPLVHDNNDLLLGAPVDGLEQIVVSLVDEHSLPSGEEDVKVLHVPVHHVGVEAFLGELRRLRVVQARSDLTALFAPEVHAHVDELVPNMGKHILILLVIQSLPSSLVHLGTEEVQLSADLLSGLARKLHLETGSQEVEVVGDLVVHLEKEGVEIPASPEDGASSRVPNVKG